MNLDRLILEVHKPNFRNSARAIERKLDIAIVLDRGVDDFDQQQDVGWCRQRMAIIISASLEKNEIGLRLGAVAQKD